VLKRDGRAQRKLQFWPSRPMNALMWAPELRTSLQISNVPPERVIARLKDQQAKEEKRLLLADAAASTPGGGGSGQSRKRVVHAATRVPLGDGGRRSHGSGLRDDESVSAVSVKTRSSSATGNSLLGGYRFVSEHIMPATHQQTTTTNAGPSTAADVSQSPGGMLMQWGQVRSRPVRLGGDDEDDTDDRVKPVKFTMAKSTRRQVLARELAEDAARKLRAKRQQKSTSTTRPTRRKSSSGGGGLSAAALQLARHRLMKQEQRRRNSGGGSGSSASRW
jgi:hypothetical protein